MRRRTLLAAIAASAAAGCTSSGGVGAGDPDGSETDDGSQSPTDTDTTTPTSTETDSPTTTAGSGTDSPDGDSTVSTVEADAGRVTFERTGDCSPGDTGATVEADDGVVAFEGCIQGSTGCSQPELRSARQTDDRLVVTVGTVETEEICTQQLVYRSYAARVEMDGDLPATVAVRHADDGETTTVAEATL